MLTRRDPFREMLNLRSTVDRLFETTFGDLEANTQVTSWGLPLDVVENDDAFLVKASVPGINPDDLEISFTDNTLTIKGVTQAEEEVEEKNYRLRERRYGSFSRSITLGTRVNSEAIEAGYENGVLTLKLPKVEEVKPKRIQIKSSKMIDAKSKDKR